MTKFTNLSIVFRRVLDPMLIERVDRVGRTRAAYCAIKGVQSILGLSNGKQTSILKIWVNFY